MSSTAGFAFHSTMSDVPPVERAYHLLISISAPLIFIVGLVGNALTLLVMRRPSFRKLNAGVYFSALACADTVCLCVQRLTRSWLEIQLGLLLDVTSRAGCKLLMYAHYTSSCCGSWLIVAFTTERLFVVCFPLKSKFVCTRGVAKLTVAMIVLMAFAANSYTLFLFDVVYSPSDGYHYCIQNSTSDQFATTFVDLALYSFIPLILLWTANIILVAKLRESDEFRSSSAIAMSMDTASMGATSIKPSRTSVMLLTVSFTFLFLTTPVSLFYFIQAVTTIPDTWDVLLVRQTVEVLSSMNPAVNFILYCLSGRLFRQELCGLFRVCSRKCRCQQKRIEDDDSQGGAYRRACCSEKHWCILRLIRCWSRCSHITMSSMVTGVPLRMSMYNVDSRIPPETIWTVSYVSQTLERNHVVN